MLHRGSCHCGRIAFTVDGDIDNAIDCNCSLCRRRGALLWFAPRANFTLLTPEDAQSTYRFNTQRIAHHFCPTCGCAPYSAANAPDGTPTVAINLRCVEGIDLAQLAITAVDGRSR